MLNGSELLTLVYILLSGSKLPDDEAIRTAISDYPEFERLYGHVIALRDLSFALGKGDLTKNVAERGYIISNLKALQATLRHLTWQTKRIAEGDYSQKVDFLGDFSDSFNRMVDNLSQTTNQLKDLAHFDSLTGIPNRLSLNEFFKKEFAIATLNGADLCAFIFDIDFFKQVNDTYGHAAGDQILIQFARILTNQFRSTDLFGRYGGEEFMAVLPNTKMENALMIGERALNSISSADFEVKNNSAIHMTVSIGVTEIRNDDQTHESMVKRCDDALYIAKNSGRNCLRYL